MSWGGESTGIFDVDVFRVPSALNLGIINGEINGRNHGKLQRQSFCSEQRLQMDRKDDVVVHRRTMDWVCWNMGLLRVRAAGRTRRRGCGRWASLARAQ